MSAQRYAVEVNEASIGAAGEGREWWDLYRSHGRPERFVTVVRGIGGDLVRVACDDREQAVWLAATMPNHGIPAGAVRLVRVAENAA